VIFLPIAQRELHVAALKRNTLWVRLAGAGAALLIGGLYFAINTMSGATPGLGRILFSILTSLAFVAAMSAGMFFTSDALSEEKREGTLGLLFLTDLHGYDVVSGKLLAAGLRGFYMLLAALPIAGVTLLMGGVTGAAFWRTCLALVNALFVSLASGLFVSSISREAQRALLATMMALIFLGGAGFLIDELTSQHVFRFSSPLFAFTRATRGTSVFWETLVVNQIIAWTLLALGCHFVARTWHDKPDKTASKWGSFAHWLKYGDATRRAKLRARLMNMNPITWLTCRERWQAASFWVITGLLLVPVVAIPFVSSANSRLQLWTGISTTLTLVLYLGIASQSCRFFVDARKNALLEILLSTPMTGERIVQGQWKAAWRMFGAPLVLFLVVLLFGAFLVH
jgi:ABC-type transport system involved in multi-copper enzyme maturation permease subunit